LELDKKELRWKGYYLLARHYKWALDQMFTERNFSAVVIVEDDLEVAPDFFEYFLATYPLLARDRSLYCVSAWNDNGKRNLIDVNAAGLLYRSDFFPGLGWMLTSDLWTELGPKWPKGWVQLSQSRPVLCRVEFLRQT
jgi:alpha-1,3-mannosyl-glycoprotein beta-1,2-N-acetylglucosaminyltransferase